MKLIYPISLAALILFLFFGYWLKCQVGINASKSISLSNLTPFKYLQRNSTSYQYIQRNNVVHPHETGTIIYDSFETRPFIGNRSNFWMRDKGKVTLGYDSNGINNSHCLLIKSSSIKNWTYAHNKFVEVLEGDIFSFELFAKIEGDNISAHAGIDTFDKYKAPIKLNSFTERIDKAKMWIKIKNRLTIPCNTKYIRVRLSGMGIGDFRFDNICFRKEGISVSEHDYD